MTAIEQRRAQRKDLDGGTTDLQGFVPRARPLPITRNGRTHFGEIALTMQHDETLVFVEMRAPRPARFDYSAETLDAHRYASVIATHEHILRRRLVGRARHCHLNVAAIDARGQNLRWLQNAFETRH